MLRGMDIGGVEVIGVEGVRRGGRMFRGWDGMGWIGGW